MRMGDDIQPDRDLIIELMLTIQMEYETMLNICRSVEEMLDACLHAAFLNCSLCADLRGGGPLITSMDATGRFYLVEQPYDPELAKLTQFLCGRVKGEFLHEECHLFPITAITDSDLEPSSCILVLWIGIVIEVYELLSIT
jgi:hypothetical protein